MITQRTEKVHVGEVRAHRDPQLSGKTWHLPIHILLCSIHLPSSSSSIPIATQRPTIMSMASCSVPHIRIRASPRRPSSSSSSSSSSTIVRCSKAEGPLRRPVASPPSPPLSTPPSLSSPPKPVSPSQAPAPPKRAAALSAEAKAAVVTLEYQRKVAKGLQEHFRQKKLEKANQGPFFGFVGKNEIANGRWAMFGFAVGLLTEYATGSDFVQQVKILLSNFGIVDLD